MGVFSTTSRAPRRGSRDARVAGLGVDYIVSRRGRRLATGAWYGYSRPKGLLASDIFSERVWALGVDTAYFLADRLRLARGRIHV